MPESTKDPQSILNILQATTPSLLLKNSANFFLSAPLEVLVAGVLIDAVLLMCYPNNARYSKNIRLATDVLDCRKY